MGYLLVTGGAGFIGAHTCIELLQAGWKVVVMDNLSNSTAAAATEIMLQHVLEQRPTTAVLLVEGECHSIIARMVR